MLLSLACALSLSAAPAHLAQEGSSPEALLEGLDSDLVFFSLLNPFVLEFLVGLTLSLESAFECCDLPLCFSNILAQFGFFEFSPVSAVLQFTFEFTSLLTTFRKPTFELVSFLR